MQEDSREEGMQGMFILNYYGWQESFSCLPFTLLNSFEAYSRELGNMNSTLFLNC